MAVSIAAFSCPEGIGADEASANFRDGVLEIKNARAATGPTRSVSPRNW
jgi:HSP20 family molecular chaperone IbpA